MRAVSTARVRADRFAATSASAADLARVSAISVAAAVLCASRDASVTPLSDGADGCTGIGDTPSGIGPPLSSQRTQSATVGQVWVLALDPTTRPKCPARIRNS